MIKKQNKKVLLFQNHGKPFLILSESPENQPPPPKKKKKKQPNKCYKKWNYTISNHISLDKKKFLYFKKLF